MFVRVIGLMLIVLAVQQGVHGQAARPLPDDTLAWVGTSVITARDFLERFELMPWPGKDRRAEHDSARIKALRSLVAERLLAQEAAARGVGKDSVTQRQVAGLERMMVRDALFRREVVGRISFTDREVSEGMKRYPKERIVLFLAAPSEDAVRDLRTAVRRPGTIDSLLHTLPRSILMRVDTMTVTFGAIDRILEDSAYALSVRRPLSGPFRSPLYGWGVLALLAEHPSGEAAKKSVPDRIRAVENILRARKQTERANAYSGSILSRQRGEADPERFERFAAAFHAVMMTDTLARATRNGFRFSVDDLDRVEQVMGDEALLPLVMIGSGPMTVRDVIDAFRGREFQFTSLHPELFRNRLNAMIRDVVATELLGREGYAMNLHNSEAVRHDVQVWADHWAAAAMARVLRDTVSVTDADVAAYLTAHVRDLGRSYAVNIREVLADSLLTVLEALDRVIGGEPMADVARSLSRRTAWAERGGVSGFFRVDSLPELGMAALLTDSGSYGGPVHLREGYAVFQVLGKRRTGIDTLAPPPDSLMAAGRKLLRAERREQAVRDIVTDLARRAGVRIDVGRLRALQVNPSNMVTRRYIGFGGVVTAVPSIAPLWDWKDPGGEGSVP